MVICLPPTLRRSRAKCKFRWPRYLKWLLSITTSMSSGKAPRCHLRSLCACANHCRVRWQVRRRCWRSCPEYWGVKCASNPHRVLGDVQQHQSWSSTKIQWSARRSKKWRWPSDRVRLNARSRSTLISRLTGSRAATDCYSAALPTSLIATNCSSRWTRPVYADLVEPDFLPGANGESSGTPLLRD